MRLRAVLIVFLFLFGFSGTACAQNAGKVVIVSLNRTSLAQVAADQSMAPWFARGSLGLLNITTASRTAPEPLYVSMGAGSRAVGGDNARLAFMDDEEYTGLEARDVFIRHMGTMPAGDVLHLGMAEIIRQNQALPYPVEPGLLGEALRQAGKTTAVLGNADGGGYSREAAMVLVDSRGQIGLGNVSRSVLAQDSRYPFGWKTDRDVLWREFQNLYPLADVILVDWGDFARLSEYRALLDWEVGATLEAEMFESVSWFLTRVLVTLAPQDLLLVVSPLPPAGEVSGGVFGYMLVVGEDYLPGGLLSSATTRRPGLAAVIDIAPLVLDHLDLPVPGGMLGRTVTVGGSGDATELLQMQADIDRVYRLRPPLLKTYVFFQIVIVLGALANLFVRALPQRRFEPLLLGLLSVPLLLLLLPLYRVSMTSGFVLVGVSAVVLVFLLHKLIMDPVARFAALAVPTAFFLLTDLLRDAQLIKVSVLGYDPVSGARYYGLGNEYMGVLVGSSVLAAAAMLTLLPRRRRQLLPVAAALFVGMLFLIVAPAGGANFGGTVTAFIAFLVTLAVAGQIRPGRKSGLAMLVLVVLLAVVFLLMNIRVPQDAQSHLGRTVDLLRQDGLQALYDVISRKASMNIRLFRYSQWSRVFLVFLSVLAVLFYRPRGILRDLHREYPLLAAGFLGIIAGSATAFLVNDSGVVAAATTLLYAGVPIIILVGRRAEEMWIKTGVDK